jgi:hypothetical protein
MLEKSRVTPSKLGMRSARLAHILEAVDGLIQIGQVASSEREELRTQEADVFVGLTKKERRKVINLANDQRRRIGRLESPYPRLGIIRRLRDYKDAKLLNAQAGQGEE